MQIFNHWLLIISKSANQVESSDIQSNYMYHEPVIGHDDHCAHDDTCYSQVGVLKMSPYVFAEKKLTRKPSQLCWIRFLLQEAIIAEKLLQEAIIANSFYYMALHIWISTGRRRNTHISFKMPVINRVTWPLPDLPGYLGLLAGPFDNSSYAYP